MVITRDEASGHRFHKSTSREGNPVHASRKSIYWDRKLRDLKAPLCSPENDATSALRGSILTCLQDFMTNLVAEGRI